MIPAPKAAAPDHTPESSKQCEVVAKVKAGTATHANTEQLNNPAGLLRDELIQRNEALMAKAKAGAARRLEAERAAQESQIAELEGFLRQIAELKELKASGKPLNMKQLYQLAQEPAIEWAHFRLTFKRSKP